MWKWLHWKYNFKDILPYNTNFVFLQALQWTVPGNRWAWVQREMIDFPCLGKSVCQGWKVKERHSAVNVPRIDHHRTRALKAYGIFSLLWFKWSHTDFQLLEDLLQQTSVEQPPFIQPVSLTQFAQTSCTICFLLICHSQRMVFHGQISLISHQKEFLYLYIMVSEHSQKEHF